MSKKEIADLVVRIQAARAPYYNGDQPIMSDAQYDALIDRLTRLDPKNPAIAEVGAEPVSEWKKYQHASVLGSLNKCNTEDQFINWANKYCADDQFFVCPKLDGLSVSLVYENGKLVVAATRGGDSGIGEDITVNVAKMGNVRMTLKQPINTTIRGEIVLRKFNHKQYFAHYSNARNGAAGVARRYDGVGCDKLEVLVYGLHTDDLELKTLEDQFIELRKLGLYTPDYYVFDTVKETYTYKTYFQENERDGFDFDVDGLVISNNNMIKFEAFGVSHNRPRAAIAAKFDNAGAETTLRNVTWQVGNSGRVTPVASFDEVELVGAKITNASLYNVAYINELGLDIGAKILVSRGNDVIPIVAECIQSTGTVFKMPADCPVCNAKLIMNGENLQCPNTDGCPAQTKGRVLNWLDGLNILELGDKLVSQLVDTGMVKTPADLYKLTVEGLASLDRMGQKSAENVYASIWATTEIPLEVFLGSLSIPLVATATIKMVMQAGYDTLDKILGACQSDLENIKGLGGVKSQSLYEGLMKNERVIEELLERGLKIKTKRAGGKLNGTKICITGATNIKRDDLKAMIEEAGGVFKSSVSKDTTFLVMADPTSTSVKAQKARAGGTKVISEEELLGMIEG